MRRLAALTLLCVVLLSGCASVQAASAPPRKAPPNPINPNFGLWFGGDSITFGRSATDEAHAYRPLVAAFEALRLAPRKHVYTEYKPDSTTQSGLTWQSSWRTANLLTNAALYPPTPDTGIVIVAIGTGDSGFTGSTPTPLATFASQYAQLIALLVAHAPMAEYICVGPWMASANTQPYEDVIAADCPGGRFVDVSDLYDNSAVYKGPAGIPSPWLGNYVTDSVHPNNAAMGVWAQRIEAYL